MTTPSFESVWPDVERRLRALLFRRGLDASSSEDIVQEVALRALANGVTYASAQDLLRWAGPVACNLHVDLIRHRARMFDGELATDHPATNDVAGEVADRMELQRALRGLAALRPADRAAIIDAVTEQPAPHSRKEAVRLAVRRHRARSRLLVVLEQLAATVAGFRWLRRGKRVSVALAAFAPVVALPLVVGWHLPSHRDTTLPPAAVAPAARQMVATTQTRADRTISPRTAPAVRHVAPAPKATAPQAPAAGHGGYNHLGHAEYHHEQRDEQQPILCLGSLPLITQVCSPV